MRRAITLMILIALPCAAQTENESIRMALENALRENIALRADLEAARAEIDRLRGGAAKPVGMMAAPVVVVSGRTHTVSAGETLGLIAARYYGSVGAYHQIFAANRDVLSNPNRIEIGQVLRIP